MAAFSAASPPPARIFNFLGRENGALRNPATSVQAPRKPRKLPKTLDADQVDKYLAFESETAVACRDSAMAELFYLLGAASGGVSRGEC